MDQKPSVHCFSASQRRSRRRQAGFSLVEILVVIGISILLLSIGISVSLSVVREQRREQTKAMMNALLGANTQFQAVRKQGPVNYDNSQNNFPINWTTEGGTGWSSSRRFVYAMKLVPEAEEGMIAALNNSSSQAFERIYKNEQQLFDRWGTELEYRDRNDGTGTSVATNIANNLLPLSPQPFFVSAGPDKAFGTNDDVTTIESPTYAP